MLWVGIFKQKKMKMLVSFFKKDLFHINKIYYIMTIKQMEIKCKKIS